MIQSGAAHPRAVHLRRTILLLCSRSLHLLRRPCPARLPPSGSPVRCLFHLVSSVSLRSIALVLPHILSRPCLCLLRFAFPAFNLEIARPRFHSFSGSLYDFVYLNLAPRIPRRSHAHVLTCTLCIPLSVLHICTFLLFSPSHDRWRRIRSKKAQCSHAVRRCSRAVLLGACCVSTCCGAHGQLACL